MSTAPEDDFQGKINSNTRLIEINNKLKGKLQEEVDRLSRENDALAFNNKTYEIAIQKLSELTQPQPEQTPEANS